MVLQFSDPRSSTSSEGEVAQCVCWGREEGDLLIFRPKARFVGRGAKIFRLIERSKSSVQQRALHNLVPRDFSLAWGRPAPKLGKSPWERGWALHLPEYLNLTRPQSVSHGREEKRLRDARWGGWEGRRREDSFSLFLLTVVSFVALPSQSPLERMIS